MRERINSVLFSCKKLYNKFMSNHNNDKETMSLNKESFDGDQDFRSFINAADSTNDYQKKIELYTNALLSTNETVLVEEALYKRGTARLEHATAFHDFEEAIRDLLAGAGPEYGKVDNTIFRKVGILVQGCVGDLDLFSPQAKNCTKWYQLGIDFGDLESYYYLGYYHYDKYQGDRDKGIALFKEGIAKGDPSGKCLLQLGEAYEIGKGVEKDIGEAERLYIQALNEGHVRAYYSLGLLESRLKNDKKAHNLYTEGAKRGDGMCMVGLAEELYHTKLEEAQKLYIKAGETGQVDCLQFAAMTYKDLGNFEMCKKYYLDSYRNGQTVFMIIPSDRELVFPHIKFKD